VDKATVSKLAVKTAIRYPKPTTRGAKLAVRHRKGILQSVRVSRKVSDPGFREELATAISALGAAAKRAQKVGATSAVEDRRVRQLINQAASHLMTAVRDEPKPKSHKLRNLALLGVLAGGTYVALKARS
jgi:hypothetical protein